VGAAPGVPQHHSPVRISTQVGAAGDEGMLARVFSDVLQRGHVAPDDNFFDLGARSVQLVQVSGQLTNLLGREVSVLSLFEHPTIRALARHLWGAQPAASLVPWPARPDTQGHRRLDETTAT
jgi:aryl carrier-like protein